MEFNNKLKPTQVNHDPLGDQNLTALYKKHNGDYGKIIDELRGVVASGNINIDDGDLEGLLMGYFLRNDDEGGITGNSELQESVSFGNKLKPVTKQTAVPPVAPVVPVAPVDPQPAAVPPVILDENKGK